MARLLSKREKTILYLTIGLTVAALTFSFVIAPVFEKSQKLNQESQFLEKKLEKYRWLISQKEYIESEYASVSSKPAGAQSQQDELVNILAELENLAKNSNVKIIDIRPQTTASGSSAQKEILIDLRTEGAMQGYISFVYQIENSLSLLSIKKFQLSSKPNTQSLEGTFTITQVLSTQ